MQVQLQQVRMGFEITSRGKVYPFSWFGGKVSHLDFLTKHFPKDLELHFIDVFGGSGVVVSNAGDFKLKTYNDIDSELVNFFRQLRTNGIRLQRACALTLYSREEFEIACDIPDDLDDFERARRFFVRTQMARDGQGQRAKSGYFSYNITEARRKIPLAVSRYHNRTEGLREVITAFKRIQIEHLPAIDLIKKYDNEQTFFYVDPPYVHATRNNSYKYLYELKDGDHRELAEVLHGIDGKAMVSGYKSELYDEIFGDWERVDDKPYQSPLSRAIKQESAWVNYELNGNYKKAEQLKML